MTLPSLEDILSIIQYDPDLIHRARKLVRSGALSNVVRTEDGARGEIEDGDALYYAEVRIMRTGYSFSCDCDFEDAPCVHVLALMLGASQASISSSPKQFSSSSSRRGVSSEIVLPMPWQQMEPKAIEAEYHDLLRILTVPQMRELAARRKITLSGLKRDIIQKILAEGLAQPENIKAALASLAPDTRRMIDYLGILGGFLVNSTIYTTLPNHFDAALPEEKHPRRSEILLSELQQAGLMFVKDQICHVPKAILVNNQPNPSLLPAFSGQIDRQELADPDAFSTLVLRLLMLAQAGQLDLEPLTSRLDVGGWKTAIAENQNAPEREVLPQDTFLKTEVLDQISQSAHQPAEMVDLAAQILAEAEFWEPRKPSRLTTKLDQWLSSDPGGQMRHLLSALCQMKSQLEFDLAREKGRFSAWRSTRGYLHQDQFLSALAICRWRLVQLLTRLPAGEWFGVEDTLRLLHSLQPDLIPGYIQRREIKPNMIVYNQAIFLGFGKKPVDLLNFEQWRATYGQVHATILATSLHWLGLCDLGWNGKNLTAFRLSRFGEYLLGRCDMPPEMSQKNSQPGLVIHSEDWLEFRPQGATPELVTFILLAGEGTPSRKNAVGAASPLLYRFTARGLGRALEAGWDETRIRSVLTGALGQPLPPVLSDRISRVCRRFGQMHIYTNMTLVQFADDYCLPELLASTQLNRILLHTFSPRLIAVRSEAVQGFLAELREKGYTPRLEEQPHG